MEDLKFKDLIYVIPSALSHEQCDMLINEYEQRSTESGYEACTHAITNILTQSTFRKVELIPQTETFNIIHNTIGNAIADWIDYLDSFNMFHTASLKYLIRYSHMYRLMKYDEGGWIHPHVDFGEFVHGSCTVALNDNYEGGEFLFFNGNHKVDLKKGDLMIFPASTFFVHQVTPITKGIRYSVNTFLQSVSEKDKHMLLNYASKLSHENVDEFFHKSSTEQLKRLQEIHNG
jgi:predicted 2-oxoglutarate/Fe(II)-dependent dioxygenase YbiX